MREALVGNAADKDQVKKAKKKERIEREEQLDDVRRMLQTDWGKRVLWRYMKFCGIHEGGFEASSRIYYNAGRRDVGLMILADIMEGNPDAYLEMMRAAQGLELEKNA